MAKKSETVIKLDKFRNRQIASTRVSAVEHPMYLVGMELSATVKHDSVSEVLIANSLSFHHAIALQEFAEHQTGSAT